MEANNYLEQVVAEQARVEGELRHRAPVAPGRRKAAGIVARPSNPRNDEDHDVEEHRSAGSAVDYRITGWWRWKTVVVPPNVYVVHTRRGQAEPLHLGLGISFSYDPRTDA